MPRLGQLNQLKACGCYEPYNNSITVTKRRARWTSGDSTGEDGTSRAMERGVYLMNQTLRSRILTELS